MNWTLDTGHIIQDRPVRTAVAAEHPDLGEQARALATQLGLELVSLTAPGAQMLLVVTRTRIELRDLHPQAGGAICADFLPLQRDPVRAMLGRAVGIGRGRRPRVLDATAGLGRDAFSLAAMGCRVTMVERSPIVAALLEDGLRRARQNAATASVVQENLSLVVADACTLLQPGPGLRLGLDCPEVIYLDPMFPDRRQSARSRKEMERLRLVLGGESDDVPQLFACAHACMTSARADSALRQVAGVPPGRIVVKRPRQAPPVAEKQGMFVIGGKTVRFDVYPVF
jgi:16S rRNA (guanine1516-N2)-methyltransferase